MIQTVLDQSLSRLVTETDAYEAASAYVTTHLDPSFGVGKGSHYYHKPLGKEIWQFILCWEETPLHALYVDAQTGEVIPPMLRAKSNVRECIQFLLQSIRLPARKQFRLR